MSWLRILGDHNAGKSVHPSITWLKSSFVVEFWLPKATEVSMGLK